MGVLAEFFPQRTVAQYTFLPRTGYATFTESVPSFAAWDGSLYDHPLTRAAIERFAVACSKLKPEFVGSQSCRPNMRKLIETWPNDNMTWPAFLARCATIYEMDTTLFVVPGLDRNLNTVALFPLKPFYTEICEYEGEAWCIFHLRTGETMAIELNRCAVVSKFQYISDIFGSGNDAMRTTLSLLDAQRQAEEQAVQNGARIRFIGKVTGMTHGEDLNAKREKFYVDNLSTQNYTGLMLYDNTFDNIEQVKEDRYIIDEDEMQRVAKQVYAYFGINEAILTNDYDEQQWGAWYEGRIEPFALALAEAITKANFTVQERKKNHIMFSSSYLEYATPESKRRVINDGLDRGTLTVNEARDILQMSRMPGGDVRMIRGEYYMVDVENNVVAESGGHHSQMGSSRVYGHNDYGEYGTGEYSTGEHSEE